MQVRTLKSAIAGTVSAVVAASCCLLPLVLIIIGIGSMGFMATMMRFQWLTIPIGIALLAVAYYLYFREKKR